jgi:hypothetical protein
MKHCNTVKPAFKRTIYYAEFVLTRNIFRYLEFGAERDAKYLGLNKNYLTRKWKSNKPLNGKFSVFRTASFRKISGILYILQNFIFSNSFNSAFNGTALPSMKFN